MKNPKHEAMKAVVRKIIAEALLDANDEQPNETPEQEEGDAQSEEAIEEFSSAGGVAGFTLPLGMSPQPPPSAVFPRRKKGERKKNKD